MDGYKMDESEVAASKMSASNMSASRMAASRMVASKTATSNIAAFKAAYKMASFKLPAAPGSKLESHVSQLLDEAGVPSFLWGEPYLVHIGVPTVIFFTGFVVPDDCLERASRALDEAKFPPCTQGETCSLFWDLRTHPIPDHHYHTDWCFPEAPDLTCGVYLYKKSRLFWSFPDPPVGPPPPDGPYYMLTSDTRIRIMHDRTVAGPSPPDRYPVKMAVPARYMEAMILLDLRDLEGKMTSGHWDVELYYLSHYVFCGGDNPLLKLEDIAEPFQEFVSKFCSGAVNGENDDLHGFKALHKLYVTLKTNGQLPPEPGRDSPNIPLEERLQKCGIPYDPIVIGQSSRSNSQVSQ